MYSITVGSIIMKPPDNEYKSKNFVVQEWYVGRDMEKLEKVLLIKKKQIPYQEKVFNWIDKFDKMFGQLILNDAKRIVYDVVNKYQIKKFSPPNLSLLAIYLSCQFHNENFEKNLCDILDILKKERVDWLFGMRGRSSRDNTSLYKIMQKIKKTSNHLKEKLGSEKFKNLTDMWRGINGE